MTLHQLIEEEMDLRDKLSANLAAQKEINTAEFLKKHGLKFGDAIEYFDKKPIQAILTGIYYYEAKPMWFICKPLSFSKREVTIYNTDSIKLIKSA